MNKVQCVIVLLFCCIASSVLAQENENGFSYVVSHLPNFQTKSGGFKATESDSALSLEATADALFLTSLFGLKQKINANSVAQYVQHLENGDFGYAKQPGLASDLESVRNALLSFTHLGKGIPNSANVPKFVKSLFDARTNLFASRAGGEGDVKSTALAFQVLELLGTEIQRQWVQDYIPSIKSFLEKHRSNTPNPHFTFSQTASPLSDNYYGILLGTYVRFDFGPADKWANYIANFQDITGGFYSSNSRTETSLESTAHALASLRALEQLSSDSHLVDLVDEDSLLTYVSRIPRNLHYAALAHAAVAVTKNFVKNFDTTVSYEAIPSGSVDSAVIQGTQLRPILTVKTFDGVAHAGVVVEVNVSYEGSGSVVSHKLKERENGNNYTYITDEVINTDNHLGALTFTYYIRCFAAGVGAISFEITDVKKVGYGLTVDPRATLDVTGKDFNPGENVAVGTKFKFAVSLHNFSNSEISNGDLDVIFSVLDSSNVAIHTEKADRKKNNAGNIAFIYTLDKSNIPSGTLSFRFEVANSNGVHTVQHVDYQLAVPMIATKIAFEGIPAGRAAQYKIGDTVTVSMEPASYPDLRHKFNYPAVDVNGKSVAELRSFYLDVKSPGGALLRSVRGNVQAASDASKYSFVIAVSPSLDSLGTNVISFRYVTAKQETVELANYDSDFEDLYEDSSVLNYTVNGDLYVDQVSAAPGNDSYYYGNDISFNFIIKDAVSGQTISRGESDQANVYLSLKHKDESRAKPFVSANEAATFSNGRFGIQWAINPNAVQGAGVMSVNAQDADGNFVNLYKNQERKEQVQYNVVIGGELDVTKTPYTTAILNAGETAFVVPFSLACKGKKLKDAQLRASVSVGGNAIVSGLPVATNDDGFYSASWSLPHEKAPSGKYVIKFYREVDRKRAIENREFKDNQQRREEEIKRLNEGTVADATEAASLGNIEDEIKPLFTIDVQHSAPATGRLPIRTEVLVLIALGAAFLVFSYQKKHYLGSNA